MPFKDPEKRKQWRNEYYQKNKDKDKEYYKQNRERILEYKKQHYEDNREKKLEKMKEYNKTPTGKKKLQIKNWKVQGMKSDDWDQVYELYTNETNCWWCNVEFGKLGDGTATFKCLDHDHKTGELRCIVCHKCNVKLG
jgi:hypothetical protein